MGHYSIAMLRKLYNILAIGKFFEGINFIQLPVIVKLRMRKILNPYIFTVSALFKV